MPAVTAILGISAFYHDSAAALVVDGKIVAAAQEERFSRKKHDAGFPSQAAAYCLTEAGLRPEHLDYVVFYDKPLTKFDRLLETYLAYAPAGFQSFRLALPVWLKDKLHLRRTLRQSLPGASDAKLVFTDHHESHAASAFFPSPFEQAAFLTLDGVGEWSTASFGTGVGNQLAMCQHLRFPHSLGLLYSAFTYYCGFKVNSGEYKLMGLAPYGHPVFLERILSHLLDLRADGSFRLKLDYFNYCQGLTMTSRKFHQLFGGPPRQPEAVLEQRHMDLAASIQQATEEIVLRMAREVQRQTQMPNLVMAGGVALNCVANGRLLREGPFDQLWIQPAAGDAGGALGAALFVWHHLLDKPRVPAPGDSQQGSWLGPRYATAAVTDFLSAADAPYELIDDEATLLARVAQIIAQGKIVGWFHGRMEFGPRALGARSILGDARHPGLQATMNLKIKFRESFRPFAPSVLRERASEYFELRADQESPYMLVVAPLLDKRRVALAAADQATMAAAADLRERVNIVRSTLPAITHVDFSARVQTVDEARHGRFYRLLKAFEQVTGCPVLVNTSFNIRGEPIVCTPEDAYRCFLATDMDALVLEDCLLLKEQINPAVAQAARQQHLAQFKPD
jgi:carbamoyltransferase